MLIQILIKKLFLNMLVILITNNELYKVFYN